MVGSIPFGTDAKNGKVLQGGQRLPSWKCGMALRWTLGNCDATCASKPTSLSSVSAVRFQPLLFFRRRTRRKGRCVRHGGIGRPNSPHFDTPFFFSLSASLISAPAAFALQGGVHHGGGGGGEEVRRSNPTPAHHPLEGGVIILPGERTLHPRETKH